MTEVTLGNREPELTHIVKVILEVVKVSSPNRAETRLFLEANATITSQKAAYRNPYGTITSASTTPLC